MYSDTGDLFYGMAMGIALGILIAITFTWIFPSNSESELAQAICDQEYDMDFDSYNDHELKCKDKTYSKEKQYDGITVRVG